MERSQISSSEMEADYIRTSQISSSEITQISSSEMEADYLRTSQISSSEITQISSSELEADFLRTSQISSSEIMQISSSEMEADYLRRSQIYSSEIWQISSSEMETAYLSSLVVIAMLYMLAGFCAVQTTGLSNSVSPLVMSLFKYCFLLFTLYSVSRGNLVTSRSAFFAVSQQVVEPAARKHLVDDSAVKFFHLVLVLFACSSVAIRHFFPTGVYVSVISWSVFLSYQRIFRSHWMKLLRRVLDSSSLDPFTNWLQVYISARHEKTNFPLPSSSTNAAATGQDRNNEKIVKTIKFAVGMTGSILFQNYFKLNSFEETLAFIYLAVAWLASITLLSVSNDFGVFNFILGNVMVGSTVAEAGLGAHTWLAFAASLLLFCLRLELKSVPCIRERLYIRVNIVIVILIIIFYYGVYLVLFVYRTHILSDSRPLFDR